MEAFPRLINMHHKYHFDFIGLLKPFQNADKIEEYRRRIGLQHALVNCSGKIWAFVDDMFEVETITDHPQHLTVKLKMQNSQEAMIISIVYAKCSQTERRELWESLEDLSININEPWMIGGDFNVITSEKEKYGGLPVTINEIQDFRAFIQSCGIEDLGFNGSKFTWWNWQSNKDCIFKRLDRCLGNQMLQNRYPSLEISHLIRTGSDHAPMLITYSGQVETIKKSFKFLNFWAKHDTFLTVVKENWKAKFMANPFTLFHHKLKKVKVALNQWSKTTYGNIFQEIETLEDVVKVHEIQFKLQPNGRRKRLQVRRIQNQNGQWLETKKEINEEAIGFYEEQFTRGVDPIDLEILDHMYPMISKEQNDLII
ncbi:uncharacterized protein LOC132038547 [Lycium ferocissimum]|uniref:uncharacterized protein LOC132038547 n=1 Tax=Lycium ferocissimum TaxID=112874 RepID=UPI002815936C|nr:uncharacterized protein LOC132038547 [Lycium ferocissimum]